MLLKIFRFYNVFLFATKNIPFDVTKESSDFWMLSTSLEVCDQSGAALWKSDYTRAIRASHFQNFSFIKEDAQLNLL